VNVEGQRGGRTGGVLEGVTSYHWMVVIIASLGWLFDCMDQRLFVLARQPAVTDLLGDGAVPGAAATFGGYATTSMILGWATGGIIFGMLSDRIGRVKTMTLTLLVYSGFTGLSGFAQTWVDFTIYRFLAGIGIGGMFGAATTLVAESVPSQFRAVALGALQALSATGNILGSLVSFYIPPGGETWGLPGWRILFFIGIVPSVLAIPIVFLLKEPQAWLAARASSVQAATSTSSSLGQLFGHPRWRRNAIVGLMLGVSGMVGLWGIGFFSPELISTALQGEAPATVDRVRALGTALQDVGAFAGMITFTFVAAFLSRRVAFLGALIIAMAATMFVFGNLESASDAYWMLPIMGFAQMSVFAGYSIYFPELFPTRLRGTGVGFCYNTVRYLAAPAPILLGYLASAFSFRTAAVGMSAIYVVGMVALIWAPETKGQELPE